MLKGYDNNNAGVSKNDNGDLIKIENDGIGMTKKDIDHTLETFYQGEYENNKRVE